MQCNGLANGPFNFHPQRYAPFFCWCMMNDIPLLKKAHLTKGLMSRVMIVVQPFDNNYCDNLLFLSFYWLKIIEKEKGR
jgi:hypothetical protein